ncbi:unnamed protein product, partial [Ceratitis capitata]
MQSRFHGSLNPFVCPYYGDTFPRKFQLVNNGRIHGKVPHSYTLRYKEFLHKQEFMSDSELKQHVRNTHGGVNPNSSNTTINSNQQHHSQQNSNRQSRHIHKQLL